MELTKRFALEEYDQALDSWEWLGVTGKVPLFASLFGDVFFSSSGGGCWFLDSIGGSLTQLWVDADDLEATLRTEEGQEQYLFSRLAHEAHRKGIVLERQQVYDFTTPAVLGGELEVENLSAADFVVSLNIVGQIHDQVRHQPPGTPIGEIKIHQP